VKTNLLRGSDRINLYVGAILRRNPKSGFIFLLDSMGDHRSPGEKVRLYALSGGFLLNLHKRADPLVNVRLSPQRKLGTFDGSTIDRDFRRKATSFDQLKEGRCRHAGLVDYCSDVD